RLASDLLPDELLREVDVLVVNEHELADLVPGLEPEAAAQRVLGRVGAVVVTLGSRGCLVVEQERTTQVAALPVAVVDTTGAGDTFCGVLAARLAAGDDLVEAARWGSVAGALAVERPGAQDAVPTAAEVREARNVQGEPS
ncbi:PfkB family carbohydrate kinase, partial [Pseudactinotalea suaedae]